MTNKEILAKVIYKAGQNGYENSDIRHFLDNNLWEMFIFDHDFAKALWGEGVMCKICGDTPSYYNSKEVNHCIVCNNNVFVRRWKYHLQQMILCEEPLKYLEKFL